MTTEADRRNTPNGKCSTMVHPSAVGSTWNKKSKDENDAHEAPGRTISSSKNGPDSRSHRLGMASGDADLSNLSNRSNEWASGKDNVSNLLITFFFKYPSFFASFYIARFIIYVDFSPSLCLVGQKTFSIENHFP